MLDRNQVALEGWLGFDSLRLLRLKLAHQGCVAGRNVLVASVLVIKNLIQKTARLSFLFCQVCLRLTL